jgi:hypothetical protein
MNSLKLLAFGNSLAAGREVVGRFREREDCVLPRFEVAPPARTDSWWRRWLARWRPAPPVGMGSVVEPPTEPGPFPAAVSSAPAPAPTGGVPVTETPAAALEAAPDSAPVTSRLVTARQREFRFEHVTVVCNDLHDADLEFVSVKPAGRVRAASEPPQTLTVVGAGA